MAAQARPGWVSLLLGRVPRPLLAALDDWSYRVARRRAQRKRMLILAQQASRSR
jgi:hypothetical protein